MSTKGVEDGITDEQAVRQVYPDAYKGGSGCIYTPVYDGRGVRVSWQIRASSWRAARAKLPLRSATPEELTAQAQSLGQNYKPGPRQATPFMPQSAKESELHLEVRDLRAKVKELSIALGDLTDKLIDQGAIREFRP